MDIITNLLIYVDIFGFSHNQTVILDNGYIVLRSFLHKCCSFFYGLNFLKWHENPVERRLSGRGFSGLSNYPNQSDVLLCFFSAFFKIFPAEIYLFLQIL